MIEEHAIVTRLRGQSVEIQLQRQSSCNHCALNRGCGTGAIGRLLGHRSKPVTVKNNDSLQLGDEVILGIQERNYLRVSLLIYGLPIFALIIAAIAMRAVVGDIEGLILIAAIGGFTGGLAGAAWLARKRYVEQLTPQIRVSTSEPNT